MKLVYQGQYADYRIGPKIGGGSFGSVYKVKSVIRTLKHVDIPPPTEFTLALKLVEHHSKEVIVAIYDREIGNIKDLRHENIVPLIDYGYIGKTADQGLFMATLFCDGGSFRQHLQSYSTLKPTGFYSAILSDFRQILNGLRYLHERILHRDLKPENILLHKGVIKIGDFGLIKLVDDATQTMTFKGTGSPTYMAPEVWQYATTSRATDLYSIGVMFFEAICGKPPFSGGTYEDYKRMHISVPAERVRDIRKDAPALLDSIIKRLLNKDPADRYQTVDELMLDLVKVDVTMPIKETGESSLAIKLRNLHDREEKEKLEIQQKAQAAKTESEKNEFMENKLVEAFDEKVKEVNDLTPELKITVLGDKKNRVFSLGLRELRFHWFRLNELYEDPEYEALPEILKKNHVVHGGYVEIFDSREQREGWNFVLLRKPEEPYGKWHVVETRMSPLSRRQFKVEPVATESHLLARNLGYHFHPTMDIYNISFKEFNVEEVEKILGTFIPG